MLQWTYGNATDDVGTGGSDWRRDGMRGSAPPSTTFTQPSANAVVRPAHARSWMLPEAKSETLLYVSNVYTITVYSYPKGKLVGTLSDFEKPYGECVDPGETYTYRQQLCKDLRIRARRHEADPFARKIPSTNRTAAP